MSVTTVFFDMGGTLLHFYPPGGDWEACEKVGAEGIYRCLTERGYQPPLHEEVLQQWWEAMQTTWRSLRNIPKAQMQNIYQLRLLTEKWEIPLTDEDLEAAESAYAEAIRVHVAPIEGALETVKWVKEQGFNLGLISNTTWRGTHHQTDLERFGFWDYFSVKIFSSDALAWKPEPDIFQQALAEFEADPSEAVYIGDSLFFDVYGAQQAGWRAIWIEQARRWMPPGMDFPEPDAAVADIRHVINVLSDWRKDS